MTAATHGGFLADILATPDDDAPRLIYADWLEEHGEEARAEFIRVQCASARCEWCGGQGTVNVPPEGCDRCETLRYRGRELFGSFGLADERAGMFGVPRTCFVGDTEGDPRRPPTSLVWTIPPTSLVWTIHAVVRRGFVHSLTCDAPDWLRHADAVRACQPVRKVRLTTWPDVETQYQGPGILVRLRGRRHSLSVPGTVSRSEARAQVEALLADEYPGVTFEIAPDAPNEQIAREIHPRDW